MGRYVPISSKSLGRQLMRVRRLMPDAYAPAQGGKELPERVMRAIFPAHIACANHISCLHQLGLPYMLYFPLSVPAYVAVDVDSNRKSRDMRWESLDVHSKSCCPAAESLRPYPQLIDAL